MRTWLDRRRLTLAAALSTAAAIGAAAMPAQQPEPRLSWVDLTIAEKGTGRFGIHTYKWVVVRKAATFLFTPDLAAPGDRDDEVLAAVRHVLRTEFGVRSSEFNVPPRPVGPFLRFDTSDGAYYISIIREPDRSVRAFGVARR